MIIRLGALGDFCLSFPAFQAIRLAEPQAHVTLLTTKPFQLLAHASPWFDTVIIDSKPRGIRGLYRLSQQLRNHDFVFDLQTSGRSSKYFYLAGCPPWSGIARLASHRHADPQRNQLHTIERQRAQLALCGIDASPPPELGWIRQAPAPLPLPEAYALLVPGAAPHRPEKRWPTQEYAGLAQTLTARGLTPVIIGTTQEKPLAAIITAACPGAIDLTGKTSLLELASLAAGARLAVGNDTGPMHLAASLGCRCIVLFSGASDPALTAPRGDVAILRAPDLADLPQQRVAAALF